MALNSTYEALFLSMRGMPVGGDELYSNALAEITSAFANTRRANLSSHPFNPVPCNSSPNPANSMILASCIAMRAISNGGNRRHADDVGAAFHQMIMIGFAPTVFMGNLSSLQDDLYTAFENGYGDDDIAGRMAEAVTNYLSNGGAV
jgi:hypothetical protein